MILWSQSEEKAKSFLLNSTNILITAIQLLESISEADASTGFAIRALGSLGSLLHLLARDPD